MLVVMVQDPSASALGHQASTLLLLLNASATQVGTPHPPTHLNTQYALEMCPLPLPLLI